MEQRFQIDGEYWSDKTTINTRMEWLERWMLIYRNSTTLEERIDDYRRKQGKNLRYYEEYGWPEQF